jgi:chromatin remodeling complex protein RSC6
MSPATTKTAAPKTTKAKAVKEAAPVAAVPVPVAAAPVSAPATKAKKAEKTVAAVVPVAAEGPASPAVNVVTPATVSDEDVSTTLLKTIADLQEQVQVMKTGLSTMAAALKTVERQAGRVIKKVARRRRAKTTETGEAVEPKPCIFTKPVQVTDELNSFLGNAKGTQISRASVTKGVMAYARSHSLLDKQTINADASLRKLLSLKEGDVLTILNLQKYLRNHYVKPAVAVATA